MASEEWLVGTGSKFLAEIRDSRPVFLIELDVGDEELSDLFRHISQIGTSVQTPEVGLCLAVAAVQAASGADRDEESFRRLFFSRLGRVFDQDEWEGRYGPCIRYCLQQHFTVELPESGRPHCYVGAVYRHAGIPVPARARFCKLLADLLRNGIAFTRDEYFETVDGFGSTVAKRFLQSGAGYEFTQRTAQLILRVEQGTLSAPELASFPNYLRDLFSDLLSRVRQAGGLPKAASTTAYPAPRLVLDTENRRLVLQFDPTGVKEGAYRIGTTPVLYPRLSVDDDRPPRGHIVKPVWREWTVDRWWWPGQTPAALFRLGDGAFVADAGRVASGSYWLVTSLPDVVRQPFIREQGSYLDHEDDSGTYYAILQVELPPGLNLPELGLSTESDTLPALRFDTTPGSHHPLGKSVFTAQLPALRILNWTPDSANSYWIWMNDGSGERRISPHSSGDVISASVACPSQGEIWIEQKAHGRIIDRLLFTVAPHGVSVVCEESFAALDATAHVRSALPAGWRVKWSEPLEGGPDLWKVPPGQRLVEGTLAYRELRLPFSLRIPRVSLLLRSESGRCQILWKEHLDKNVRVLVEGLPNARCSIQIEANGATRTICELGALPPEGVMRFSCQLFRDALMTSGFLAGEFVLDIAGMKSQTGSCFASARAIESGLAYEDETSAVFRLPDLGDTLREARGLFDARKAALNLAHALEETPLREFLCTLAYGAAALEGTSLQRALEEYQEYVSHSAQIVVEWLSNTRRAGALFDNLAALLDAYPADAVRNLAVGRWRELAEQFRRQLEADKDLPSFVAEWRDSVVADRFGKPESGLAGRPGGRDLTEAAQNYLVAFSRPERGRLSILAKVCEQLRKLLATESGPVVRLVACGLLQLAYYHSEHESDAGAVDIPDLPTSFQRLGASMRALAARCRNTAPEVAWRTGLGFAEISPRTEDAELEVSLGRTRLAGAVRTHA